jgi:hypothetical protein
VLAGQVVAAVPWRPARGARGQAHYPGYYWSATSVTFPRAPGTRAALEHPPLKPDSPAPLWDGTRADPHA